MAQHVVTPVNPHPIYFRHILCKYVCDYISMKFIKEILFVLMERALTVQICAKQIM